MTLLELIALHLQAGIFGLVFGLGSIFLYDRISLAAHQRRIARRWAATQARIRDGRLTLPADFTPEMIAAVQQFGQAGISFEDAVRALTPNTSDPPDV